MTTKTRSNLFVSSIVVLVMLSAISAMTVSAHPVDGTTQRGDGNREEFLATLPEDVLAELEVLRDSGDKEAIRELFEANNIKPPAIGRRQHPGPAWIEEVPEELRDDLETLMEYRDREAIDAFLEENGIEIPAKRRSGPSHDKFLNSLPEEVRQGLRAFHEAGDREGAKSFLEDNGFVRPDREGRRIGEIKN